MREAPKACDEVGGAVRKNDRHSIRFAGRIAEEHSLLSVLFKARYLLLIAALAGGMIAVLIRWIYPVLFHSVATVQVIETGNGPEDPRTYLMGSSPSVRSILQQAVSTNSFDQVIRKMNLDTHYSISRGDPYYKEKLYTILNRRVHVSENGIGTVSIEASDPNPVVAAAMANTIAKGLQEFSQNEENNRLQSLKKMYSVLIDKDRRQYEAWFNKLLEQLKNELEQEKISAKGGNLQFQLDNLSAQLSSAQNNMGQKSDYYEMANVLLESPHPPKVKILNTAVRDIHTSKMKTTIITVTICTISSVIMVISILTFWHFNSNNILESLTTNRFDHPKWNNTI